MRLNEKLLEKDHQEFERVESAENVDNLILSRDLDYFKKETKLLREQVGRSSNRLQDNVGIIVTNNDSRYHCHKQ